MTEHMAAINEVYPDPFADLDPDAGRCLYLATLDRTQGDEPDESELWDMRRRMTWQHFRETDR